MSNDKCTPSPSVDWARAFIGRIEDAVDSATGGTNVPGMSLFYEELRRKLDEPRMGQPSPVVLCESCEKKPASAWCSECIVEDHEAQVIAMADMKLTPGGQTSETIRQNAERWADDASCPLADAGELTAEAERLGMYPRTSDATGAELVIVEGQRDRYRDALREIAEDRLPSAPGSSVSESEEQKK